MRFEDLFRDRDNYVQLQAGDEGYQAPAPAPAPAAQAPRPLRTMRDLRYEDVSPMPDTSTVGGAIMNFLRGGNSVRDWALQGQKFEAGQETLASKRQQREVELATTEANLFKAIRATPAERRKPLMGILDRFYERIGQPMEPAAREWLSKANDEDFALSQYSVKKMAASLGVDEREANKWALSTPTGFAEFMVNQSELEKQRAQVDRFRAETESKRSETAITDLIRKREEARSAGPTNYLEPSPGQQPTPGPQVAPRAPQGPPMQFQANPRQIAFEQQVDEIGKQMGASPHVIAMVKSSGAIETDNYNPQAVSPKGARGPLQFMPETAKRFGVQDPTDPAQAITGSLKYYTVLDKMFPGRPDLQLASYNAGEGRVQQAGGVPDIKETQQYVQRGMQRYNGLLGGRPANEAALNAPPAHQGRIAQLNQAISNLQADVDSMDIYSLTPRTKALLDAKQERLKSYKDEVKLLQGQLEPKAIDMRGAAAQMLGLPANPSMWGERTGEVMALAGKLEAEDAATKAKRTKEATRDIDREIAEAGNANQVIKDVTEFRDTEGNTPRPGTTYADLKKEPDRWRQVKDLTKDRDADDQASNRLEFITNLQELADKYGTITTGPVKGRVERWKLSLGIEAKDDVAAQRLLLDKVMNEVAFLRGGKALTANEIERIQKELPKDTDETKMFREKLNKALELAHRYHTRKLEGLEKQGYFIPDTYRAEPPRPAGDLPTLKTPPGTPAARQEGAVQPPTGKAPNPIAEAIRQEQERRRQAGQ